MHALTDERGIVAHLRDPYLQRQATHKLVELTGRSYADAQDAVQDAVTDAWRLETRCASALAWHRWLVTCAVHKLSRMPQAGGAGVPATQGNARAPVHVDAETMCRWAAAMCGERGSTLCALLADELTLGEAGAELDVTRERARQLKTALAARLFARATKPLDTRKALC